MNPQRTRRIARKLSIPAHVADTVVDYQSGRRNSKGERYTMWGLCCLHGIHDERDLQDAVYNIESAAEKRQ